MQKKNTEKTKKPCKTTFICDDIIFASKPYTDLCCNYKHTIRTGSWRRGSREPRVIFSFAKKVGLQNIIISAIFFPSQTWKYFKSILHNFFSCKFIWILFTYSYNELRTWHGWVSVQNLGTERGIISWLNPS